MKRPYLKDRLIEERPEGFVIIVPVDADPPLPFACPTCDYVLHTRDDEVAYAEFGCCDRCARLWAQPRRQVWKDGWRPTAAQVIEAEADRPPVTLTFDVE